MDWAYKCIRPSVQTYISFVTQPLYRMHQNAKNRHKNRPCKRALRVTSLLFHIDSFSFFFSQHRFHISVDCRSLIRLMLDPDEKTRITCEGILEDTWCEQGIEKVVNEMRRPSLAPDDTRSLPVMSNRKRSSIVPKPPTLPTIHSNGKQNISRRGEIPTSIGTRWSKFMKIKSNPP